MSFISDFSLFPVKKVGHPGWSYRKATWPGEVDPEVHKLIDKETTEPVYYTRAKIRDGTVQNCKVCIGANGNVIMEPGDGFNYLVRRDSTHNKEPEIDDSVVPHDMLCKICLTNKSTHAVLECGHVSMCAICAKKVYDDIKACPICKTPMSDEPIKLFFA
ncbi:RING finger protein [Fadolivirus algeromassiliense]|jgi:hypothetical protein|uniref:RING finger protein n=1 Tax=Fadolivirus FV1/VV64 TaxID=3070911 RepID=A0A7D3R197_9VIRU|nr:RING finger protein [Fadolivirus algeromassiliense]QKF93638.1 RING finger protein [Fadolivirus FV1/VV64]